MVWPEWWHVRLQSQRIEASGRCRKSGRWRAVRFRKTADGRVASIGGN